MHNRPISRQSVRPNSRASVRSLASQVSTSRFRPQIQQLIGQVTSLESDPTNFDIACDFAVRYLNHLGGHGAATDEQSVERRIKGFSERARINVQDNVANALDLSYDKLKTAIQDRMDMDIDLRKPSLPNLLQLLFELSTAPSPSTLAHADIVLANDRFPQTSTALTWQAILEEEPFEGEHWEGAWGLPPGSIKNAGRRRPPSESTVSDSDSDIPARSPQSIQLPELEGNGSGTGSNESSPLEVDAFYVDTTGRAMVEGLQDKQYWRSDWRTDARPWRSFELGDASTFGPALAQALAGSSTLTPTFDPSLVKYINEADVVREILLALQGYEGCVIQFVRDDSGIFREAKIDPDAPRVIHLSLTAYHSVLSGFVASTSTLQHLRQFISSVYQQRFSTSTSKGTVKRHCQTLEAFAEAVDSLLREFNQWAAGREGELARAHLGLRGPLLVSLLGLERDITDVMAATFESLYGILVNLLRRFHLIQAGDDSPTLLAHRFSMLPATLSAALLDELLSIIQVYISMGDRITTSSLIRVFGQTAEPIWRNVWRWMKQGMNIHVAAYDDEGQERQRNEEFFICQNSIDVTSPEFWATGYTLRSVHGSDWEGNQTGRPHSSHLAPQILTHVATEVLAAGKAVGLLRALGDGGLFGDGDDDHWLSQWSTFEEIVNDATADLDATILSTEHRSDADIDRGMVDPDSRLLVSTDSLELLIYDRLTPLCRLAQLTLKRVLVDDCDLWEHLEGIENVFLMKKVDSLSQFCDVVFARMETNQSWTDFHFLNTAFRDVTTYARRQWIDPSLVRFSHQKTRDRMNNRTVRAFNSLSVEYAVPFPLTYLFGSSAMQTYSSIFVFLFQMRRVKTVIESILIRGTPAGVGSSDSLKPFYALRGKFQWFINTMMSFIVNNVLQTQISEFHRVLKLATSLDDMIAKHDAHLEKVRGRCLLGQSTSAIHRAVISIFDLAMRFSECFSVFAGDLTHDTSRRSFVTLRKKRRRHRRRQLPNVVGFGLPDRQDNTSDESEEEKDLDDDVDVQNQEPPDQTTLSWAADTSTVSFAEDGFFGRLEKISSELDELVRFVRRGVESLSTRTGDAAAALGMFAFALEDWDI